MSEFHSPVPLPGIPDNLSIPQFILREHSPLRPIRPRNVPFFIEDSTGRGITYEEVVLILIAIIHALIYFRLTAVRLA